MKRLICIALLTLTFTSCTKSIAVEEELPDKNFYKQKVGASARQLLSDEQFRSLRVEVQYMRGFAPDSMALVNLEKFLYAYLHKPAGIHITTQEIEPSEKEVLTLSDVAAIENSNRTRFTSGKEIVVYILYTNGYYQHDKMLGYAYRNTSAVLFGKNIVENASNPKTISRTNLETQVLQHEMGHLLGLVNVGSPLQSEHKDDENGKHCRNKKCLMYHQADTEQSHSLVYRKPLPKLDKACLDDLRANGGK